MIAEESANSQKQKKNLSSSRISASLFDELGFLTYPQLMNKLQLSLVNGYAKARKRF